MTILGFIWLQTLLCDSIEGFIWVDELLLKISVFDIYVMSQDVTVNCKQLKLCTNDPHIEEINDSYPLVCVLSYFNIYNTVT